jgi:hypothetical protein
MPVDVEYDEVEDEQLQQRDLVGDDVVFHREHQRDGESDTLAPKSHPRHPHPR